MKTSAYKYMRDFYPEEMRLRLAIEDRWRLVSERAGFEPWDAPILEYLELYKRKSGDEIVSQLFTLTTKGDSELAVRPEMTPSLARMIAAKQASLPRPIKWYTVGRMCRYERGQRGRLREFWQWNIDILGVAGVIADAEVISTALDALIEFGLDKEDVEVRLNSRTFLSAILEGLGVSTAKQPEVFAIADRKSKASPAELDKMFAELGLEPTVVVRIKSLLECKSLGEVDNFCAENKVTGHESARRELDELFDYLSALGKSGYARFDIGIVRGLAYYTGPVFEIFDRSAVLRAICGGGRYDNLMAVMGGQPMPACGFGMGDVVLLELLKDKAKLPAVSQGMEYQVIALDDELLTASMSIAQKLRSKGHRADFLMKAGNVGKALKKVHEAGTKFAILVSKNEWAEGIVKLRDMTSGEEKLVPSSQF